MSLVFRKRKYNGDLVKTEKSENSKLAADLIRCPKKCSVKTTRDKYLNNGKHLQLAKTCQNDLPKCLNVSIFVSDSITWLWFDGAKEKYKINQLARLSSFLTKKSKSIASLSINCTSIRIKSKYADIEKILFENCCNFLLKLNITATETSIITQQKEPLIRLKELKLTECDLSGNLTEKFATLFPSLRQLILIDCKVADPKCIEATFDDLKRLKVHGKRKNRNVFTKNNIEEMIRLNPQICHLDIEFNSTNDREYATTECSFDLNVNFFRFVGKNLPNLQSLCVYGERQFQPEPCEDPIEFNHLKQITIEHIYKKNPNELTPFTFKQLRELKLNHLIKLTEEWMEFIILNVDLVKLTLGMDNDYEGNAKLHINRDQLIQIVRSLRKLEKLYLPCNAIQPVDVVAILPKRKTLQKIHVCNYNDDSFVQQFDKLTAKRRWYIDFDMQDIIIKRLH